MCMQSPQHRLSAFCVSGCHSFSEKSLLFSFLRNQPVFLSRTAFKATKNGSQTFEPLKFQLGVWYLPRERKNSSVNHGMWPPSSSFPQSLTEAFHSALFKIKCPYKADSEHKIPFTSSIWIPEICLKCQVTWNFSTKTRHQITEGRWYFMLNARYIVLTVGFLAGISSE